MGRVYRKPIRKCLRIFRFLQISSGHADRSIAITAMFCGTRRPFVACMHGSMTGATAASARPHGIRAARRSRGAGRSRSTCARASSATGTSDVGAAPGYGMFVCSGSAAIAEGAR